MPEVITPDIVNLFATVAEAPQPSTLQKSGALLSFGGTILTTQTYEFVPSVATLLPFLSTSGNFEELQNAANSFFAQGNSVGFFVLELGLISDVSDQVAAYDAWKILNPDVFYVEAVPAGWPQSKDVVGGTVMTNEGSGYVTVPAATFEAAPPGGVTATGTAVVYNGKVTSITSVIKGKGYLVPPLVTITAPPAAVTAEGTSVLTGDGVGSVTIDVPGGRYPIAPTATFETPPSGVTATGTPVIDVNGAVVGMTDLVPGSGYVDPPAVTFSAPPAAVQATATSFLSSAFAVMAKKYANPTSRQYFVAMPSLDSLPDYASIKSIMNLVPSPTADSTEFQSSMPFYNILVNDPSAANRLNVMANRNSFGLTKWARNSVNNPKVTEILSNYGNYLGDGAEGGLSNVLLKNGTLMDGSQFSLWYGVDWFLINVAQALAALIIESANSQPPLLYNPDGINALQRRAQSVATNAQTIGCLLQGTVTAIPFATYVAQFPDDYAAGIYSGLSATIVGQNGFLKINFYVTVFKFVPTGSTTPSTLIGFTRKPGDKIEKRKM